MADELDLGAGENMDQEFDEDGRFLLWEEMIIFVIFFAFIV